MLFAKCCVCIWKLLGFELGFHTIFCKYGKLDKTDFCFRHSVNNWGHHMSKVVLVNTKKKIQETESEFGFILQTEINVRRLFNFLRTWGIQSSELFLMANSYCIYTIYFPTLFNLVLFQFCLMIIFVQDFGNRLLVKL